VRGLSWAIVGALAGFLTNVSHAAAPSSGLVGYWPFDEPSGSTVLDGSGNNNSGALTGSGATRTTGRVGSGSLSFNGSSGRVTIPHSTSLNLSSSFTLTAWLRPTSLSGYQTALHKGASAACSFWLQTKGTNPTSGFSTASTCSSYAEHVVTNTTLQPNVWYHVAARFDNAANTFTYYLNANPVYSASETRTPVGSQESLILGESPYAGSNFERWRGQLDEVRIYNRALTVQEIADVFNDTGTSGPPADTEPPTVPANVTATAVSTSRVDIAWSASSDNVGVAGYRIYRGGTLIASAATTSYADSGLQPGTTYSYRIAAYDAAQNASAQSSATTATTQSATPPADSVAPSVSLTAPASSAIVRGSAVSVTASASDNVAVVGVQFLVDGSPLGAEDTSVPYALAWNTTGAADGAHQLAARARDAAGNVTTSPAVSVRVDNGAPTGTIAINGGASATSSTNVTLTLSATDAGSSVTQMRFSNGGTFSAPESFAATRNWTLSSGDGVKTVAVQYSDASSNWSPSFTDTIALDSTAPTISSVTATNIGESSATITWLTNEGATSRVEYGTTLSYGQSTPQQSQLVTSHSVALANLTRNTTYNYRVRSIDAGGNERISANSSFTTAGADTQAPTTPTNVGATAFSSSVIDLSWAASTDDVGPITYGVLRNGNLVASGVATTTYRDSGLAPATTYSYTVRATDGAGNASPASAPVQATTSPPTSTGPYVYPLQLSSDRRTLLDQNWRPFFMNGDTAWALFAQISKEDAAFYFANRQQKGYNAVLASLIERRFASNAPRNVYGDAPFATGGTFTTPNESYFAHADWVINAAAEKGIVVIVDPLYLGYACGNEGWCPEVRQASSSALRSWGRYVGARYRNFPNIIWMIGGDVDPVAAGIAGKVREFVAGLRENDTVHPITAHNDRGQSAMDPWPNEQWLDVNNIYTGSTTYIEALSEYNRGAAKPLFFVEGYYENEHGMTSTGLRNQAYSAVLSGATAGHLFGNCPIWNFGFTAGFCTPTNWQQQLDSTGSRTVAHVGRLFLSRPFNDLVPDQAHTVVTAGYQSGLSYAAAARTSSGGTVIVYMPSRRTITVDMTKVSGTMARAWWFNPSTAQTTLIGDFATSGSRQFTPATFGDWVLVLDDLALGLSAPGT
jgi:chitodextrinase